MSDDVKAYEALRKSFIDSLAHEWHPQGDGFFDGVRNAFIEYFKDDVRIWPVTEGREELMIQAYINDSDEFPDIGKEEPLSRILVFYSEEHGVEETERVVANSMAAFRKKVNW